MGIKIQCFKNHTATSVPSQAEGALTSCEVTSNSCYCKSIWITWPWTSLLGPHARLDWRGTSPDTDAFSFLELLTERTRRSFPDNQITLTRKLASIATSALATWKPLSERRLHPPFSNLSQRPPTSPPSQAERAGWQWSFTHTASGCLCWVLD